MQNILRITHLRMKWYNEKVGALNSKRTDDKLLLLMIKGIPGWSPNQFLTVTYVPHRLSRGFARYVLLVKLNILRNFERGFQKILEHSKISTMKSLSALWIKREAYKAAWEKHQAKAFQKGQRVTSAVRYVHFSVLLSICLSHDCSRSRRLLIESFSGVFGLYHFSTITNTLIHLNFYNTE